MVITKKKKIIMILSLIWSLSLFSVATYAWVARNWTPELEYSEVTIATSGALVISIDDKPTDNETTYNEINLNSLTNTESFALKQVSSADGKSFVGANFNPVLDNGVPIYDTEVAGKYIETEFWLKAQSYTNSTLENVKDIYLHKDTDITYTSTGDGDTSENLEYAIRVSIELPGVYAKPIILCKDRTAIASTEEEVKEAEAGEYQSLSAASTDSVGENVYEDYKNDKNSLNTEVLTTQLARDFESYTYNYETQTGNKLFTISSYVTQKVIVRIWLEGCDKHCISDIAGKTFSLTLKFDSVDKTTAPTE